MGWYDEHIVPRCVDFACGQRQFAKLRASTARGLSGVVLELGFGSGLNLPHYPSGVTRILAVDPSELGKRLARERLDACPIPVEWSGLDGEALDLPSASADGALCTFTLCTIPHAERALREVMRVLKPGAPLHFLEHGRNPDPKLARWQDRLTPINKRIAGGCHLNRPIADLVRNAGFCLDALENYYAKGPKPMTYLYEGRARACG
jgi:ubiquinone/menaquinone biosynthesis C-methylase UbiE